MNHADDVGYQKDAELGRVRWTMNVKYININNKPASITSHSFTPSYFSCLFDVLFVLIFFVVFMFFLMFSLRRFPSFFLVEFFISLFFLQLPRLLKLFCLLISSLVFFFPLFVFVFFPVFSFFFLFFPYSLILPFWSLIFPPFSSLSSWLRLDFFLAIVCYSFTVLRYDK